MSVPEGFNYSDLNVITGQVADLESVRISLKNRYHILVALREPDKCGKVRGNGYDIDDKIIVGPIREIADHVEKLEVRSVRFLEKYMRNSPWGPWLASEESRGVGAKQLARLLGATGDPYWHMLEDRPRRVSELWAYCGYHVINGNAPRRVRGEQSNWSEDCRKRAFLIAESCMKQKGQYRAVYDTTRIHYEGAVHNKDCIRCGPSGKPALTGSLLALGHCHARALRAVAKTVLRDLWIESRRHHGVADDVKEFA